jgi:hypothetical protein
MQQIKKTRPDDPADTGEHARIHTAQMMAEYLFSLSMMCKHYGWHKTGMHLCAAGDELEKMLKSGALTQKRYVGL